MAVGGGFPWGQGLERGSELVGNHERERVRDKEKEGERVESLHSGAFI